MFTIISTIIISISFSLLFSLSPLSLGIWVIILTLLIIINISLEISSWFPILFFLIYAGALLVLFSYFVAIQPNQQLGFRKILITLIISTTIIIIFNKNFLNPLLNFSNISSNLIFIISFINLYIVLFLALILFLTLVVVVKISCSRKAPLRPYLYVFTNSKRSPFNQNYK